APTQFLPTRSGSPAASPDRRAFRKTRCFRPPGISPDLQSDRVSPPILGSTRRAQISPPSTPASSSTLVPLPVLRHITPRPLPRVSAPGSRPAHRSSRSKSAYLLLGHHSLLLSHIFRSWRPRSSLLAHTHCRSACLLPIASQFLTCTSHRRQRL